MGIRQTYCIGYTYPVQHTYSWAIKGMELNVQGNVPRQKHTGHTGSRLGHQTYLESRMGDTIQIVKITKSEKRVKYLNFYNTINGKHVRSYEKVYMYMSKFNSKRKKEFLDPSCFIKRYVSIHVHCLLYTSRCV